MATRSWVCPSVSLDRPRVCDQKGTSASIIGMTWDTRPFIARFSQQCDKEAIRNINQTESRTRAPPSRGFAPMLESGTLEGYRPQERPWRLRRSSWRAPGAEGVFAPGRGGFAELIIGPKAAPGANYNGLIRLRGSRVPSDLLKRSGGRPHTNG